MNQPIYHNLYAAPITDELIRIHQAQPVQGEQSSAIQMDMKQWALKAGMWATAEYGEIVEAYAKACGWKQEYFTGMEIL